MTTLPADDEFTRLEDADFHRVDLVGKGANGIPRFLVMKEDGESAGLLEPDFVRDLISKSEPEAPGEQVTMTGSPAAIAKLIHEAGQRRADDVAKAELSGKSKNDLPDSAFAHIESGGKKDADGKTTPRSLRHYPVQDACIIGSVEIPLLDGSQIPIRDLVGLDEFWVYSFDPETRAVVPGRGHSARMTMEAQTVARVILDSGEFVVTTPDHRFMLRSGEYRMAQDLAPGDSLMPLYRKIVKVHDKDYERLWQPFYRYWELTHHAVDRYSHGPLLESNIVHHRNEDQFDNTPGNLEQMTRAAHLAHHGDITGPKHLARLHEGSRRRWATPGAREKQAEHRRRFNLQMIAEGRLPTKPMRDWCATRESATAIHERYMAGEPLAALGRELGVSQSGLKLGFKRYGLPSRKQAALLNNHKVVCVEFIDEPQPVYDLTVDQFHNFAIDAGVFVHNSHARNALGRAQAALNGNDADAKKIARAALPKIRSAAKKFGVEVSKEAGDDVAAGAVTKADPGDMLDAQMDDGVDGLDPTVPLAAPEDDAPGDPTDPGSPAWEAIDAATAQKWCSILSRAEVALELLAEREMLEAASADPDDAENAWDMQDACCAIDYVISVLAPYAVAEQSEADCGADDLAAIGKAMAGAEEPLGAVEAYAAVMKAGRVLSSANEALIRTAGESLQKVLASLPQAPLADDTVTKETAVAADQTKADEAQPVAKETDGGLAAGLKADLPAVTAEAEQVAKDAVAKADASGDGKPPMQAVFDQKGNLIGIVDPSAITPVAGADGNAPDAAPKDDAEPDAETAPAADPGDLTPAPAADTGTPADDVAKGEQAEPVAKGDGEDPQAVLKSIVTEAVSAALGADPAKEEIAKQAGLIAKQSEEIEALKARLVTVEETPAAPKVFTNGATPPAGTLRGQDKGAAPVDVAKARERKAELYAASGPDQARIAKEMQADAIGVYEAMRAAR